MKINETAKQEATSEFTGLTDAESRERADEGPGQDRDHRRHAPGSPTPAHP